ncbi:hypothetical protein KAR91_80305, partial [Candidatus Pacearchaeota archaeon]|nr:hypothetical protein [Candidatus Pacearchaeota archaeon]
STVQYRTQDATDAISNTRALIEETRLMGVDVVKAEKLLQQAESMFEQHDFDAVEEYIRKSTVLVEDIKLQHREQVSTNELEKVYESLAEAKELKIDVSAVEEFIKTAEEKLKVNDYDAVDEYLLKSHNILSDSKERHIRDNIVGELKKVKNSIFEAKQLGLNIEPFNELLQQAESAYDAKKLEEAEDIAKRAKKMIEDSKHEYLSESIVGLLQSVKSMISEADTLGIDTATPKKSYNQAEAFFKSKDYEKAKSFAIKAEGELNETAKDYIQDTFPKLTIDLPKEGLQVGDWNRYSFEITNEGKISAKDINFDFEGKDIEVKGIEKLPSLDVGETQIIELGIKPEHVGDIPMDVKVSYHRPFDHAEYEVEQEEQVLISSPGTYVLNDAFLIYKDGILISHASREFREDMDEDIFSGMLTAVQDFIKDSFQRTGNVGLRRLDFGQNKILIERGKNLFVAIILAGAEPKFLSLFLIEIIKQIEEKYGEILDDWSGKLDDLSGIDEYIERLLGVTVTEDGKLGEGVDSSLVPLQMLISEAKSMGTDVTEAEELLTKAENVSSEEDFETVWEYVKQAESLVEHVKIQHYKGLAEEAFSAAKARVSDAQNAGVDDKQLNNLLSDAQKAMDIGDYDNALAIAEQCNEAVVKAEKHHEVATLVDTTKARAEDIKAQGFEIDAVDKKLEEATEALEHEDYEQVVKIIDRTEKLIDKSMVRVDEKLAGEI